MSDQHRFRNDRPKATGRRESDQGNEHMDEKNEDIAHTPNANRASEGAGIHADLVIRHQQVKRSPSGSLRFSVGSFYVQLSSLGKRKSEANSEAVLRKRSAEPIASWSKCHLITSCDFSFAG